MKPMTRLVEPTHLWFPSDIDLHKIAYRLVMFESEWN
jgi:hypothetical protein